MIIGVETTQMLKRRVGHLIRHWDERGKRLVAANEALRLGYGGVSLNQLGQWIVARNDHQRPSGVESETFATRPN
jgi:hypothetical protein